VITFHKYESYEARIFFPRGKLICRIIFPITKPCLRRKVHRTVKITFNLIAFRLLCKVNSCFDWKIKKNESTLTKFKHFSLINVENITVN
jgi:hypothetical protein